MFNSESLMPHAVCWAAAPGLIWTMVVTNFITFLSYLTICCVLLYLARRTRKVLARDWAYFVVGFALFIVACGSTHLLEVITTWNPIFWVDAATNVVTAVLSASVAVMLIQRVTRLAFGVNDYADRLANAETEKEQLQESLMAAQKLEDWSRMSAVVSHEIKNPLQAIQNLQYLIRSSEGVSPQVIELAGLAEQEAQRVLAISEASLSFIRQTARPETIDLREAVESSRFLLAPLIAQKGIVLEVQSQGDCTVEAYAGETRQVVLNLLRNACEAISQAGKRVVVQMTGHGSRVELVVTDEGAGIAPEVLPSIFQFGMTTKGERGNGMGLWTVKHILNKHCGEVRVESQPGQRTRIELLWPRIFEKTTGEKQTVLKMDAPLMGVVG
jgi:signal transduction histidine kinase